MIRAVLDTKVIVSGIAEYRDPRRTTGRLIRLAMARRFILVLSGAIVDEAIQVLSTKRCFRQRMPDGEGLELVWALAGIAEQIEEFVLIPGVAHHHHDDPILATVAASGADWFVTGDRELLAMRDYAGVPFTDPNGFLAILDPAR